MKLQEIPLEHTPNSKLFQSQAGEQLLEIYQEYYSKIGFTPPWVGYSIWDQKKLVGSCGFTGKPQEGKVELAYWTFEEFEGKGIASLLVKN